MKQEQGAYNSADDYIHQGVELEEDFDFPGEDQLNSLPDDLEVAGQQEQQIYTDEDRSDSFDSTSGGISANTIELAVRCEIGMVSVSLEKLMQLRVGDVFELSRWPNTVKLTVNGAYFAEGILVEVEGMLGVKLTRKLSS